MPDHAVRKVLLPIGDLSGKARLTCAAYAYHHDEAALLAQERLDFPQVIVASADRDVKLARWEACETRRARLLAQLARQFVIGEFVA
jgi:hypothetical protein